MGTDIHPVVQQRIGGTWRDVPLPTDKRWDFPIGQRNYNLFAILADVRNGHGFAGTVTGLGFEPIQKDRGFPPDFEAEGIEHDPDTCADKQWCDHQRWMGDHSFGWVTLAEIEAYPWEQSNIGIGVLSAEQYEAWDKVSQPESWCGGIDGPGIVTYSAKKYEAMKQDGGGVSVFTRPYVRVAWQRSNGQAVGMSFFEVALPWLRSLGAPDDVRIVFGFDS